LALIKMHDNKSFENPPLTVKSIALPRRARLDSPGTLHHVIIRGIEKGPIVDDDDDRKAFVDRMGELSQVLQTPVYAWALMTNHAHILLRSGAAGLSSYMRKLLTFYAGFYNRRHRRHGHLFQNRYKSIIVQEDTYFKELVRYIHLNPLRAGMVDALAKLDAYSWSGHSAIMGRSKYGWQDCDDVLKWFGRKAKQARQSYRGFVEQGIGLGSQPHLVGGGLVRSVGGWSQVKALRRIGGQEKSDERILGSGDFVEQILSETDLAEKYRLANLDRKKAASRMIQSCCKEADINGQALLGGSRNRQVSKVRRELSHKLTKELGLSYAETARLLGVSTSAVSRIITRSGVYK
jgi:putative transposase